jgi:hypothetical protein
MRNIGVSLSIVIGGVIFQNGMRLQRPTLQAHGLPADLVDDLSGPDAATNINLISTIANQAQKLAVRQAFAWSLRNLWITCTCMAALGLLAAALVTKTELSKEHTETKTGLRDQKDRAMALSNDQQVVPAPASAPAPAARGEADAEQSIA